MPKSYGKSELAMLYFPDSNPHVALNRLNSWIRRCPPLADALADCSQSLHAKYYSPKAVRLITDQIADFIQQQCSIKKSDIKAALDIRGQPADTRTAEQKAAIRRLINDLQPK